MTKYLLYILIAAGIGFTSACAQHDYSVNLGRAGLDFVKLNAESRLILMNRQSVVVASNIIKINKKDEYVYGERTDIKERFFLLFTGNLSVKYYGEFSELAEELSRIKILVPELLEPGLFAKQQKAKK